MSTILAHRKGEWFLASFAKHLSGCNLATSRRPMNDAEQFHLWQGTIWVWSHAPLDEVAFFPEIRYQGLKVWPQQWHPKSAEPLLMCLMLGDQITASDGEQGYLRRVAALKEDGWEWRFGEGGTKYISVHDLEKIQGPPPELTV